MNRRGRTGLVLWGTAVLACASPLRAQTRFASGEAAPDAAPGGGPVLDLVELRPGEWGVPGSLNLGGVFHAAAAPEPSDPRTRHALHAYRAAAGLAPEPGMLVDVTVGDQVTVRRNVAKGLVENRGAPAAEARPAEIRAPAQPAAAAKSPPARRDSALGSARLAEESAGRLAEGLRRDPTGSREEASIPFDAGIPRKNPSSAPVDARRGAPRDAPRTRLSPRRVRSLESVSATRWKVNGAEARELGGGSSKSVVALAGDTDAAVKIFQPLWHPERSVPEMTAELETSRALEALGATPRVLEHGSFPGPSAPVGYMVVEKVHGLDFQRVTNTKLELAADLFRRLARAGVWIGDEGKLRVNLMAGSTASRPDIQAWLVDADAAVLRAGRPADLARRYQSVLESWAREASLRPPRL